MKDYEKEWKEKQSRLKNGESIEEVDLTAREFDFLIERAENFRGKIMDMSKYKKWLALQDAVSELCEINEEFDAGCSPPERTKRHAVVGLSVPAFMTYEYEERDLLIKAIKSTDCITIAPACIEDENHDILGDDWSTVVIGLHLCDVWMDDTGRMGPVFDGPKRIAENNVKRNAVNAAGAHAENAWADKLKRSQNGERVDFADEELRSILAKNKALQDKEVNLACFKRWVALSCAAEALCRKSKNYSVKSWPPTGTQSSGFVSLFLPCYKHIGGAELHLIITMMENAHTVRFTPTTPVSATRAMIQFSVDEIWGCFNPTDFLL